MKAFTTRTKRIILPAILTGISLFFLLAGSQHPTDLPCESFTSPPKEYFKQDVEPCTEPDSGTDNTNFGATAGFMIGLPVLN
jgi:hypothetical protein